MKREQGFTYLEMIAAITIMMILASAILPLARVSVTRTRELALRRELRVMRTAIDAFQRGTVSGKIATNDWEAGQEGYPRDLEQLVKGVPQVGKLDTRMKFLRRIPTDPMTGKAEWGMRCYTDDPDSTSWCGDSVYDVYSKSTGVGLDGTPYKDW